MILGVIPARGGASLKDKNIRPLCGRPLIVWTIEAALKSKIDRLIVSTDNMMISDISENAGAEVFIRPIELAGPDTPSEKAILNVLERVSARNDGVIPEYTVFLQCTSPLTQPEDINACIEALEDHDSVFSVQKTTALLWDKYGPLNHDWDHRPMRQKRIQYEENGAIYAFRTAGFMQHKYRFFGKSGFEVTGRNVDIDTEEDFVIAEALMRHRMNI